MIEIWLLVTALVFTAVGWFMAKRTHMSRAIEGTIESLIEQGYLKTQGSGDDMVFIRWQDWEQVDSPKE